MADAIVTATSNEVVSATSIEDEISRICLLSEDELLRAKGSSQLSGVSLTMAKQMSIHRQLSRSYNKSTLIDNIII